MPRAVIFDVDGTLVDSVDLHARSWQEAFEESGHPTACVGTRGQIGKGGDQLLPVFLSEAERATEGPAIEGRRAELLKERYLARIRPFGKVRDLFERLRRDGTLCVLASSAKQEELEFYKKLVHIEDLVAEQTSSEDAERSKPHPDIFQAAMRRLPGIAADDMLVIGDTPYDAQAAAQAGLRAIGMLCGGFAEADLRAAGCVAIYRDPADLLARYEASPLNASAGPQAPRPGR